MKTVVFLVALLSLDFAEVVSQARQTRQVQVNPVGTEYVQRQKKVLSLLENIEQLRNDTAWWKIGYEYDVQANINNYTNRTAVQEFLAYNRSSFMPKDKTFSVFHDRMREEAIALFKLFYYAKNFATFYKTAAYARVHFNAGQFLYAYLIGIYQRPDTYSLALPAPYEIIPQYFVNTDTLLKAYRVKMQGGDIDSFTVAQHGIFHENNSLVFYSNYSSPWITGNEEDKLSYFTEDIGMNSYYYYFKTLHPFWWNEDSYELIDEEMQDDTFYFAYQQLIAKYYLERLSNGMGDIPEFSWFDPIETGYFSDLSTNYPFFQRNEWYYINKPKNSESLQFLDHYEQTFLYYLDQGQFTAYNEEIDLRDPKAIDFVSKYWFTHVALFKKSPRNYERSYELTGLHLLAGTPEPADKYTVLPSALELYQTSLRDPIFYQFYARVLNYMNEWKKYLKPYSYNQLHFEGVNISNVTIDELVTFFEFYDFDISNDIFYSVEEIKSESKPAFMVRQPRLNHKPFTITVQVNSNIGINTDSVFKFFLGPIFDSNGFPLSIEDNWMNFVELDWFVYNLTPGQNKIERCSQDFKLFKEDPLPVSKINKILAEGKVPFNMTENFFYMPNRMMLPKGVKGGFPFQIYTVAYPYTPLSRPLEAYKLLFPDAKPMSYPFDRPVTENSFKQPNIYNKDVFIYHDGEEYANIFNVREYYPK